MQRACTWLKMKKWTKFHFRIKLISDSFVWNAWNLTAGDFHSNKIINTKLLRYHSQIHALNRVKGRLIKRTIFFFKSFLIPLSKCSVLGIVFEVYPQYISAHLPENATPQLAKSPYRSGALIPGSLASFSPMLILWYVHALWFNYPLY